ncbi:MAG: 16S rRNA (adenine(1518)-N(6)/adenine(1519)-N(6))-dimethyltransferase RsmA [Candidatus Falkowbacteria bacterium]
MNLLEQTKEFCRLYDIKPARSKGQNFLIKEKIYDDITAAADLKPYDMVLEVGPGLGFLTAKLAVKVKKVIAVELDDKLAEVLKTGLAAKGVGNVEVVNSDVLKTPLTPLLKGGNYKIVANLPYNITSIFLRKFLSEVENKPELMVLMLQKEVAERICAQAGKMSLLAVSVQFYAQPEIVQIVPAENFWPEPEVDSAIIKLEVRSEKFEVNEKDFFRLVKFGFSAKRKMLKNNLAAGFRLETKAAEAKIKQAGLNPKIRAQELAIKDWFNLVMEFYS